MARAESRVAAKSAALAWAVASPASMVRPIRPHRSASQLTLLDRRTVLRVVAPLLTTLLPVVDEDTPCARVAGRLAVSAG